MPRSAASQLGGARHRVFSRLNELRGIGASVREHLRFRHPEGEAALRYNVLQKLAYLAMILFVLPGLVLMGLAMSPGEAITLGAADFILPPPRIAELLTAFAATAYPAAQ